MPPKGKSGGKKNDGAGESSKKRNKDDAAGDGSKQVKGGTTVKVNTN